MGQSRNDKLKAILENQPLSDTGARHTQVRKNSQQALLYLSSVIAGGNQRFYTVLADSDKLVNYPILKTNSFQDYVGTGMVAAGKPQGWTSGYKNIVPVLATPRTSAGLSFQKQSPDVSITRLTTLKAEVNRFFNFEITSADMASMVPVINLYKLDYKLKNGKIDREIEPVRRPIVFEEAITKLEMEEFVLKGGNLGSSGIESFRWALKGVNPAEVDSNIEATLKVYFNHVGVFQRALDEIKKATTAGTKAEDIPASFVDLITFAPPVTKNTADLPCLEDYDPHYFEIEAQLGWGCPDTFPEPIKKHIKEQNVSLFLTLTDHKFDFHEDGTATLEVNYRARSTMNAREHDILKTENSAVIQSKKAIADAQSTIDTAQQVSGEATGTDQELLEAAEQDLKNAFATVHRRLIQNILNQTYVARLPNALLLNAMHFVVPGNAMDGRADTIAERGYMSVRQLMDLVKSPGSSSSFSTMMNRLQVFFKHRAKVVKVRRRLGIEMDDERKWWRAADFVVDGKSDYATSDAINKSGYDQFTDDISKAADGYSDINFLYLGDILEVILQIPSVVSSFRKNKFAVVTTDFKFINYYALLAAASTSKSSRTFAGDGIYRLGGVPIAKLRCAEGLTPADKKTLYSSINVANIPINLELFLDFYVQKVIRSNRTTYYLEDFLNDLFNSLVKPSIADPGIYGAAPQQPALININVETDTKKSALFGPGAMFGQQSKMSSDPPVVNDSNLTFVVPCIDAEGAKTAKSRPRHENMVWSVDHYTSPPGDPQIEREALPSPSPQTNTEHCGVTKILGVTSYLDTFDGDYANNNEKSIKNFVIGLDRGIVKSVTFDRVDQPYLREARTAKSKDFGTGQLRELYNVTLTLYGNNLLKPGEIIYVEANSLIFGKPTVDNSAARVLGLGGYHLVVDVENEISKEGWQTTVKALHMSMPSIKKPTN